MATIQDDTAPSLARELLCLYDEFSEFEARCAFFCDAVAALGTTGSIPLESASAGGLPLFTDCLKAEVASLKEKLNRIRLDVRRRNSYPRKVEPE